jgi:hypothetical protein
MRGDARGCAGMCEGVRGERGVRLGKFAGEERAFVGV